MKKLFTLLALLTVFFSAKAVVVVDSEVDFSTVTEFKDYLYNNAEAASRISIVDGCLHFESAEATGVNWDCQFSPLPPVADMEEGVTYYVTIKIKGSPAGSIAAHLGGTDNYSAIQISEDWSEYVIEYPCTDPKGPYSSNDKLNIQCGSYVGYYDIASIKITHEERDQKPVDWKNMIVNGDAEGEYGEIACVQSQEFGMNLDEKGERQIHNADIETVDGNKVFVSHAKAVNPPLLWAEDGEQWGQQHSAGDPKPDNAWQNQLFIVFPRAIKDGEQIKISFKYKASKAVKVDTQAHKMPGDYLDGGKSIGQLSFSTDWQTYSSQYTASGDTHSIAFNLGTEVYDEDIDFYLDDLVVEEMDLERGFFAAGNDVDNELTEYDYENAVKLEWDDDEESYICVVGTKGDQSSWVNALMISTVRGNDKAFQTNTIKISGMAVNDPDAWVPYSESSKAVIKLPAKGVWQVMIDEEQGQINFIKLEGEEDQEPIGEVTPNQTVITINGVERDYTAAEAEAAGVEAGTGQPWDNQFIIMANRKLGKGEVTIIEFDYAASKEANVGTQCGGGEYAGQYIHYDALGDLSFTAEEQHFTKEYTVPAQADGMQAFNFNMAVIKEACVYTIKNVVWKINDEEGNAIETLIDMEGDKNFYVKTGAGTSPAIPSGIANVVSKKAYSNVTFNLAGQRVAKNYKGIVIKNGVKTVVK